MPRLKKKRPLEKHILRDLLSYLEQQLLVRGDGGQILSRCDHTLQLTRAYLAERHVWSDGLPDWLGEYGGFCDCEVMYNVFDYWTPDRLRDYGFTGPLPEPSVE